MANEIWIAVNLKQQSLHVLEHEGDYGDDDFLVNVKPSVNEVQVRVLQPEKN